MKRLNTTYVIPDSTPAPSIPVCHRFATNQIGDRQIISLNEPILDVPGNGTWTGADSGTAGLHQKFIYEEVTLGVARIRDWNYVSENTPNNLGLSVAAEQGDLLFAMCYARHATATVNAFFQIIPSPVSFDVATAQADGSVGHVLAGHHLVASPTPGFAQIAVGFSAAPTYAVCILVSVVGALSAVDDFDVSSQASATPGLSTLINTRDWNQNLAIFATHESGIDHTVAGPWTERAQVTHSDLYMTLIERWAPSEDSSFFPEITVDSWSSANTVMAGIAAQAGNFVETLDQQYIVVHDPVGSGYEDGEALTNA